MRPPKALALAAGLDAEDATLFHSQDRHAPKRIVGGRAPAEATRVFDGAEISVETGVFALEDAPERLAEEASGFFYSAFVLSDDERRAMLQDLAGFFARQASPRFEMPVNRLVVRAR